MKCPCCNAATRSETRGDGGEGPVCPECGWGREASGEAAAARERPRGFGFFLRYGLMCLVAVVVAVGPYLAIRYVLTEMGEFVDTGEALAKLNLHYGWVFLVYLVVCWTVTPEYDRDNLGIFGGDPRSRYNPAWTPEQHGNRAMRTLSGLLMPGKVVLAALGTTRDLLRGRKEN